MISYPNLLFAIPALRLEHLLHLYIKAKLYILLVEICDLMNNTNTLGIYDIHFNLF